MSNRIQIVRWWVLCCALAVGLCATQASHAVNVLHYSVNDTDAATVAGGTVPGVGSPNGTVAFGSVTLSTNVPVLGVPAGSGNRSLDFNGSAGVNLPGTQQLLNTTIEANGGFVYEAWANPTGGGNINSIIDYAGTEKLVRQGGPSIGYRNNSANPLYAVADGTASEWHYAAVRFTPTAPVAGGTITGNFAFFNDSNVPTSSVSNVTISTFGDGLNRTVAVGSHPLGFGADFFNGQIYEPRVSLGALPGSQLLYQSVGPQLIAPVDFNLVAGSEFGGFPVQNLVNASGLSQPPTIDNYMSLNHSGAQWTTDAFFPDYYTGGGPVPVIEFFLDDVYSLTDLVAWNYSVPGNAARQVTLEFSTDGGFSYGNPIVLEIPQAAGPGHTLSLGAAIDANAVQVTFDTNWVGFGAGGDRVGLAELRFIGQTPNTIPEPATASFALLGLGVLAMRRRRAA